jgi:hypothetical protein
VCDVRSCNGGWGTLVGGASSAWATTGPHDNRVVDVKLERNCRGLQFPYGRQAAPLKMAFMQLVVTCRS